MMSTHRLDNAILGHLKQSGPCPIEDLMARLPAYSWNQVFGAVDRLARESKVVLLRPTQSEYVVVLHPMARLSSGRAGAH